MADTTALSRGDAILLCRGVYPQKLLHLPLTGWLPARTLDLRAVPSPLYPLVRSIHSCNAQVWRNVPVQTTCCCLNCWAEEHRAQGCRWHRQTRTIARARWGRRRWQGRKVLTAGPKPPAGLAAFAPPWWRRGRGRQRPPQEGGCSSPLLAPAAPRGAGAMRRRRRRRGRAPFPGAAPGRPDPSCAGSARVNAPAAEPGRAAGFNPVRGD